MDARALGISNEEQGEHVTQLQAQCCEGCRTASNYLLRGFQRKQDLQTKITLQSKKMKRILVAEGKDAEYSAVEWP